MASIDLINAFVEALKVINAMCLNSFSLQILKANVYSPAKVSRFKSKSNADILNHIVTGDLALTLEERKAYTVLGTV